VSRPLRLLFVYDCVVPNSMGGVEQRNHHLAVALAERGHRVTLAGWSPEASSPHPGVEVLPVGRPGRLYTRGGRRRTSSAIRFARDVARIDLAPFDAVETANIPYLHLFPLARGAARAGRPLCVTWYEYWGRHWRRYLRGPAWPAYAAIERLAASLGRAAVAVSALTAGRLARRRGEEVPVIPVGVSPKAVGGEAAAGLAEQGPGPPLVYAGRLVPEKRLDLLLAALRELARRLPERPLLAVIGDGPERARLEGLAADLGVSEAVTFRGRLANAEAVWRELGRSRVAVQPSAREGFGIFPLEALAAGVPVVHCASAESAVGEIVRHGVEGLRTEPSPEALAAALVGLLADGGRGRLAALGESARARAREYSWDAVAGRVEALFLELVERGKRER